MEHLFDKFEGVRLENRASIAQKDDQAAASETADKIDELPRYLQKILTKDQQFVKNCFVAIRTIKDVEVKTKYIKWFLESIKIFEKGDADHLSKLAGIRKIQRMH